MNSARISIHLPIAQGTCAVFQAVCIESVMQVVIIVLSVCYLPA